MASQSAGREMELQETGLGTHLLSCPGQIPRRGGLQAGKLPMATDWALPLSWSCLVPSPGSRPDGSREKGLTGPKGHRDAGFRGKGKGREGAERQRILHRDGRRQKRGNESHRDTDSDRPLEPETQCDPGDREMGTEMQTATGRLRLPGEISHTGC